MKDAPVRHLELDEILNAEPVVYTFGKEFMNNPLATPRNEVMNNSSLESTSVYDENADLEIVAIPVYTSKRYGS